jgi:predicted cobalt transporter CbtA
MVFRRDAKLFQLVTFRNPLKTAVSLAVFGLGGFIHVQLTFSNGVSPNGPAKTAQSYALRASQPKNWVRTVTQYYSTLRSQLGDYFLAQNAVAQLTVKQVLGGCHA